MSDTDNVTVVETNDDLEAFEKEFYQTKAETEEPVVEESTIEDAPLTTETDEEVKTDEPKEETPEEPDDDSVAKEDEPSQKKNRKSAQERINELTREKHEAERREADTLRRLEELERKLTPEVKKEKQENNDSPDPDSVDDKGEPKYPLGEYDPQYIRDLTKYTLRQEREAAEIIRLEKEKQTKTETMRAQAQLLWNERLEETEKELPDVKEKIEAFAPVLATVDKDYGQFLVDVVMSLDNGPRILHYLADNPKETQQIVTAGPTGATISLGRLDARMAKTIKAEEAPKKVTKAPEPPEKITRGSGTKIPVAADTDDLDAFDKLFFKKK